MSAPYIIKINHLDMKRQEVKINKVICKGTNNCCNYVNDNNLKFP